MKDLTYEDYKNLLRIVGNARTTKRLHFAELYMPKNLIEEDFYILQYNELVEKLKHIVAEHEKNLQQKTWGNLNVLSLSFY